MHWAFRDKSTNTLAVERLLTGSDRYYQVLPLKNQQIWKWGTIFKCFFVETNALERSRCDRRNVKITNLYGTQKKALSFTNTADLQMSGSSENKTFWDCIVAHVITVLGICANSTYTYFIKCHSILLYSLFNFDVFDIASFLRLPIR